MSKEIQKQITQLFQIQELLGSGAYGHVWKVQEKSTKQTYALKKVFDAFQNDIDAQRTYREITILHQLNNPAIIKLKDVIKAENDKDLYLIFQHMQTDLHSLVGQNILEMPHLTFIIYQIFKALKYIHSAQLVHRDLKPSNILINSDCQIKLCDFGLVRSLTHQECSKLILSQDVATRWYRSPQMLLGSQQYGWPTDVWSVGCILAQLIIGQPIMMGGSNIEQLQKILQLTGIPKYQDLLSIKSSIAQSLISKFKILKKPFKHYFKGSKFENETSLINLIKSMLQFNPQKRITVEEVLQHEIFEQIRDESQEVLCKKIIIPQLDDNVRLTVNEYRDSIYKDIERRYPEYNAKKISMQEQQEDNEQDTGRIGSIFRYNRGHHSLMNRNSSTAGSGSIPRSKATNSLIRPVRQNSKPFLKAAIQNSTEIKAIQHQSLHCNTAQTSNFYKFANLNNSLGKQKQYMGSLHSRKNPFIASMQNKEKYDNKDSTDVSTVVEKSPFRKYKKFKGKQDNSEIKIDKIQGLQYKENNLTHTTMITKSNTSSKQKLLNNNINSTASIKGLLNSISSKQSFHNNGNINSKLYFYDPTSIYRASPPKQLLNLKKEKNNMYKVSQISNQNKIIKKTFTKFRKDNSNANSLTVQNKVIANNIIDTTAKLSSIQID